MKSSLIKKEKYLSKKPNLIDYDEALKDFSYERYTKELKWFDKGKINAAYNAITRNAYSHRKNKTALYWVGENEDKEQYTFLQIEEKSNQIAHYLKDLGIEKGDRAFLFLPRIPELYFMFIVILKIGAVAGSLFAAFGPQALFDRLSQSGAKILITTSEMEKRLETIRSKLEHLE